MRVCVCVFCVCACVCVDGLVRMYACVYVCINVYTYLLMRRSTRVHLYACVPEAVRAALLVVCLTSQQRGCVSQGQICSGNCTCFRKIETADQTLHLTQSHYTDTGPTRHLSG